jgi:ribosome recycling factor
MYEITKETYVVYEKKMLNTIRVLREDLNTIRAGRANPKVLDRLCIDYYGAETPINQLSNIQVPDPRLITIAPFDPSVLKLIEKAIQMSDLGINPQNDGKILRLAFPALTEERRKDLAKVVSKHGEEAKVAIRNVRREAIDMFKDLEKKKEISEDNLADAEDVIQRMTDQHTGDIDKIISEKEKELMAV